MCVRASSTRIDSSEMWCSPFMFVRKSDSFGNCMAVERKKSPVARKLFLCSFTFVCVYFDW